jgi:hypothetical protein
MPVDGWHPPAGKRGLAELNNEPHSGRPVRLFEAEQAVHRHLHTRAREQRLQKGARAP